MKLNPELMKKLGRTGVLVAGLFSVGVWAGLGENEAREKGRQEGIDVLRKLSNKVIPDYDERMKEAYETLREDHEEEETE